jgi:hypothetical protein
LDIYRQTPFTASKSSDGLYVEKWVYSWGALLQTYFCAKGIGRDAEAAEMAKRLRANHDVPIEIKNRLI